MIRSKLFQGFIYVFDNYIQCTYLSAISRYLYHEQVHFYFLLLLRYISKEISSRISNFQIHILLYLICQTYAAYMYTSKININIPVMYDWYNTR